jgi:ubiquinone/menaquinone biosynthesis C-methylase UbiE
LEEIMTEPSGTYVLDSGADELDRLVRAAGLLAPIARSAFAQAGLSSGGRAIDLGCGPLGGLATLHAVVGDDGLVVGVDQSAEALRTAQSALERLGIRGVRLVEADINTLTPQILGGADFDLAYCRLVLMHQADPAATLRTVAGLVRPGGSVVVQDYFAPPRTEPATPAVDRAFELVIAAARARGASPDASRQYRQLCAAAGLEVIVERGTFIPMPLPAVLNEAAVLLSAARRGVEAARIASATEVDNILAALRPSPVPTGARAWSPQTVGVVAVKPA